MVASGLCLIVSFWTSEPSILPVNVEFPLLVIKLSQAHCPPVFGRLGSVLSFKVFTVLSFTVLKSQRKSNCTCPLMWLPQKLHEWKWPTGVSGFIFWKKIKCSPNADLRKETQKRESVFLLKPREHQKHDCLLGNWSASWDSQLITDDKWLVKLGSQLNWWISGWEQAVTWPWQFLRELLLPFSFKSRKAQVNMIYWSHMFSNSFCHRRNRLRTFEEESVLPEV